MRLVVNLLIKKKSTDFFLELFFSILLMELFLGGGGRIFSFGFFSLRMFLFAIAVMWSLFLISSKKLSGNFYFFIFLFLFCTVFSTVLGLINGGPLKLILEDVKPLTYFVSFIFFGFYINSYKRILKVISLIKLSSLLLAITYLVILVLINTGLLSFQSLYRFLSKPSFANEFMFRGTEGFFFYKGFIILCVGFFFYVFSPKKNDKYLALLIFLSIFLTFVRGFLLTIFLSFVFYSIISFDGKFLKKRIYLSIVLILATVLSIVYFITKLGNRDASDFKRIVQIDQVFSDVNLVSIFIGHGFGNGVPVRPIHMEITYLEVFHKQGLFGLFFWLLLFGLSWYYFNLLRKNTDKTIAIPFFLSIVVIYTQSLTNPYLNNPIGISVVLISICVLRFLYNENQIHVS